MKKTKCQDISLHGYLGLGCCIWSPGLRTQRASHPRTLPTHTAAPAHPEQCKHRHLVMAKQPHNCTVARYTHTRKVHSL